MIGIVVVAHSRPLAEAAVALARQMVHTEPAPRVVVAAGLPGGDLGTDATAVAAAVAAMDGPDGVLVLSDLGSAVLSAELALELLPPDVGGRVRLSGAPLVEGLVAALVLAATGADLDTVAAEADRGLVAKQAQLADQPTAEAASAAAGRSDVLAEEVVVANPHALHARPAARVVALAGRFDATVRVTNLDTGRGPAAAASLSALATLDARTGHRLRITAEGSEARAALDAVVELARQGFGDGPPGLPTAATPSARGSGLDLALGPALVRRRGGTSAYRPGDPAEEARRSAAAVGVVAARFAALERAADESTGAVLGAQQALLTDPEITAVVAADLAAGVSAVTAWAQRLDAVAERFAWLADPYQAERAADVRGVQAAVLAALTEVPEEDHPPGTPVILVVDELDAATAAAADPGRMAGIVTVARGRTGHGAIIAASRGIPLFTGAGTAVTDVRTGQRVAFDARRDRLWTEVSDEQEREWPSYVAERREAYAAAVASARGPARTRDGTEVPVLANLGSRADAESAYTAGADGAGLVRTEVLFADRRDAPGVDEQTETLLALAGALGGRRITVRTWDVGGDKPLPFLPLPQEANPFLGVRGVRAFLGDRAPLPTRLLVDQLAAVCRAARETPLAVMFPMVTERPEVDAALALLREAAGGERPAGLRVGIMVEVPAAALTIRSLAAGLDFVSVGTNDLTGYVSAADRGSDAVAGLADPLSPAVLRLVDLVVRERPEGVTVAVCGDLASRPDATPLLLGLGVGEFSCTASRVPEVKQAVRRTDRAHAQALAVAALQATDAAAVRALLREHGRSAGDVR